MLRDSASTEDGLGLVEVIVATLILGVIALMMLPALTQGIALSVQQSATATATRYMNELIESARDGATCESVLGAPTANPAPARVTLATWSVTDESDSLVTACPGPEDEIVTVFVSVSEASTGDILAGTTALIYLR